MAPHLLRIAYNSLQPARHAAAQPSKHTTVTLLGSQKRLDRRAILQRLQTRSASTSQTSTKMVTIKRTEHDIYPFISADHRLKGAAQGKTVLITGGGKGIGKATARQFARAGASKVIIHGRDSGALDAAKAELEAETSGVTVVTVTGDITTPDGAAKLFEGNSPDVLVNNAGVSLAQQHIADSDPEKWWQDWLVNVRGTYLTTRQFLHSLKAAGGKPGIVINVSSSVADLVSPNMSSYGSSKAAVNRLTEIAQLEYGKQGVRVHAFHPGGIAETGMGQTAPEQFRHRLIDTVALAGGTALYLSTPDAEYLAGRFVYSNWDMEKVQALKDEIVSKNLLVSRIDYGSSLSSEVEGLPPA